VVCSKIPPQTRVPFSMAVYHCCCYVTGWETHLSYAQREKGGGGCQRPALKDFFGLERHRAKTLGGLLARLAAKVAAYTCGQRINDSLGRPLLHLADLLL
jgi:hypothetical protein